jgi:hypothetical protein
MTDQQVLVNRRSLEIVSACRRSQPGTALYVMRRHAATRDPSMVSPSVYDDRAGNDAGVRASRMSDGPDRAAEGGFVKAGLGNPARHITY